MLTSCCQSTSELEIASYFSVIIITFDLALKQMKSDHTMTRKYQSEIYTQYSWDFTQKSQATEHSSWDDLAATEMWDCSGSITYGF